MKRRTSQKLLSRLGTAMCTALLCFSVTAAEYMPNFKDTDINEFINIVGKNLERTIIVDPNVRGKISVRSYDMLDEDQYYQFFMIPRPASYCDRVIRERQFKRLQRFVHADIEKLV